MSGAGELVGVHSIAEERDGGRATLVLRRFLRHPPSTVWRAITDPEQIRQWFLSTAKIDGRVGGTVEMTLDPVGVRSTGRIVAWEPPRLYAYELTLPNLPELGATGERNLVRWELTPVEGGTLLVLTQRQLTTKAAEVLKVGLPFFVLRLEAHLDGRPPPDWTSRVEEARRFEVMPSSGRP
jgi:uncharacterized protein YndB with AHSA1/START domain